jgi:hypothetical protein
VAALISKHDRPMIPTSQSQTHVTPVVSDRCEAATQLLSDHRARMTGLRAAHRISVRMGYAGHVARLGPKIIAGERETERLLAAMYSECGSPAAWRRRSGSRPQRKVTAVLTEAGGRAGLT